MSSHINSIKQEQVWEKWILLKLTDNVKNMLDPVLNFLQWSEDVCEITILHEKFDEEYNKINDLLTKSEISGSFSLGKADDFIQDIVDLLEISLEIELYSYEDQFWPMIRKISELLKRLSSHLHFHNKTMLILQLQYEISQLSVDYQWGERYLKIFNNDI